MGEEKILQVAMELDFIGELGGDRGESGGFAMGDGSGPIGPEVAFAEMIFAGHEQAVVAEPGGLLLAELVKGRGSAAMMEPMLAEGAEFVGNDSFEVDVIVRVDGSVGGVL